MLSQSQACKILGLKNANNLDKNLSISKYQCIDIGNVLDLKIDSRSIYSNTKDNTIPFSSTVCYIASRSGKENK